MNDGQNGIVAHENLPKAGGPCRLYISSNEENAVCLICGHAETIHNPWIISSTEQKINKNYQPRQPIYDVRAEYIPKSRLHTFTGLRLNPPLAIVNEPIVEDRGHFSEPEPSKTVKAVDFGHKKQKLESTTAWLDKSAKFLGTTRATASDDMLRNPRDLVFSNMSAFKKFHNANTKPLENGNCLTVNTNHREDTRTPTPPPAFKRPGVCFKADEHEVIGQEGGKEYFEYLSSEDEAPIASDEDSDLTSSITTEHPQVSPGQVSVDSVTRNNTDFNSDRTNFLGVDRNVSQAQQKICLTSERDKNSAERSIDEQFVRILETSRVLQDMNQRVDVHAWIDAFEKRSAEERSKKVAVNEQSTLPPPPPPIPPRRVLQLTTGPAVNTTSGDLNHPIVYTTVLPSVRTPTVVSTKQIETTSTASKDSTDANSIIPSALVESTTSTIDETVAASKDDRSISPSPGRELSQCSNLSLASSLTSVAGGQEPYRPTARLEKELSPIPQQESDYEHMPEDANQRQYTGRKSGKVNVELEQKLRRMAKDLEASRHSEESNIYVSMASSMASSHLSAKPPIPPPPRSSAWLKPQTVPSAPAEHIPRSVSSSQANEVKNNSYYNQSYVSSNGAPLSIHVCQHVPCRSPTAGLNGKPSTMSDRSSSQERPSGWGQHEHYMPLASPGKERKASQPEEKIYESTDMSGQRRNGSRFASIRKFLRLDRSQSENRFGSLRKFPSSFSKKFEVTGGPTMGIAATIGRARRRQPRPTIMFHAAQDTCVASDEMLGSNTVTVTDLSELATTPSSPSPVPRRPTRTVDYPPPYAQQDVVTIDVPVLHNTNNHRNVEIVPNSSVAAAAHQTEDASRTQSAHPSRKKKIAPQPSDAQSECTNCSESADESVKISSPSHKVSFAEDSYKHSFADLNASMRRNPDSRRNSASSLLSNVAESERYESMTSMHMNTLAYIVDNFPSAASMSRAQLAHDCDVSKIGFSDLVIAEKSPVLVTTCATFYAANLKMSSPGNTGQHVLRVIAMISPTKYQHPVLSAVQKHQPPYFIPNLVDFTEHVPVKYLKLSYFEDDSGSESAPDEENVSLCRVTLLPRTVLTTIETYADQTAARHHPMKQPSLHEKEVCLVMIQLISALKCLQAQGIEEVGADLEGFLLIKTANSRAPQLVILWEHFVSLNIELRSSVDELVELDRQTISLCQCALACLCILLHADIPTPEIIKDKHSLPRFQKLSPFSAGFQKIADELQCERASSLTAAKSMLEYLYWAAGRIQGVISSPSPDGDQREHKAQKTLDETWVRVWLENERAKKVQSVVKTMLREKQNLDIVEEYHAQFLLTVTVKQVMDAFQKLEADIEVIL